MRDGGLRWKEPAALALLVAIVLGVPLSASVATGSLWIPHNDAWSHTKIAQHYAQTGEISLLGWNRTALLGQVLVLGRAGDSIAVQQVFVALVAAVGLVATYALVRRRTTHGYALAVTAVTATIPEYGLLSTSFMSDVPAFSGFMLCLATADLALRRNRHALLLVALVIGLWGATVREQAIAGPVACCVAAVWLWRGRIRLLALVYSGSALALFVAFELWRRSLPYGDSPVFTFAPRVALQYGFSTVLTLALYISPLVALVARPTEWTRRTRLAAGLVSLVAVAAVSTDPRRAILGNYLDDAGAYMAAMAGRREVLPSELLAGFALWAGLSVALLLGHLLTRRPPMDPLASPATVLLVGGTAFQALAGQPIFARYLLPLLPLAALLIAPARHMPRKAWDRFLIPLSVMSVTSFLICANALAFDAARWRAGEWYVRVGYRPSEIAAGLEWVGYHADGPAFLKRPTLASQAAWYVQMFPGSRECVSLSASPSSAASSARVFSYRKYTWFGDDRIYGNERALCLSGPS